MANEFPETKFVPARCTNCGAELTVDPSQEAAVCKYCDTPFIISKAIQNYNFETNYNTTNNTTNNITNVYNERKSAVESYMDYAIEKEKTKQQSIESERQLKQEKLRIKAAEKEKRKKLIWWVLGWIFIFPVPLTILLLRNKELDQKIRYGLIAVAWIGYVLFVFIGGRNKSTTDLTKNNQSTEITKISGTYYGVNGSILTLLPDKTAYYYYKDFSSANTDASWSYLGDTLTVSIPYYEDKIVLVTATATVDSNNVSSFTLSSSNIFWDNELYKKISSDTNHHTKAEYDEMINKNQ